MFRSNRGRSPKDFDTARNSHAAYKRLKSGYCEIHKMFVRRREVMELNSLQDLYVHELKDLYSAEKQLIRAIPKMEKAAKNKELANGFQEHLEQTKEHAQRLERVLSSLGQTTRGPKCKGTAGIVADGAGMIKEEGDEDIKDAGLIAAAQRVEHYEMAGYGTARTYAELLGDNEGVKLLFRPLRKKKRRMRN